MQVLYLTSLLVAVAIVNMLHALYSTTSPPPVLYGWCGGSLCGVPGRIGQDLNAQQVLSIELDVQVQNLE